ncbi:MAG: GspE/PulE family protein [Limnochordia bacterium]|jgi:type IV pilus assembly protein PilB
MGPMRRRRLGDILIERGVLTAEQLGKALERQLETRAPLGAVLVEMGLIKADVLADALAEHLGVPRAEWRLGSPDPELALLIPMELLREGRIFPLSREGDCLRLAMADPLDIFTIDAVRQVTGLFVEPAVATEAEIKAAFDRVFNLSSAAHEVIAEIEEEPVEEKSLESLMEQQVDSPGVKMVNLILVQAVRDRVSDIHIEPREDRVIVRFRVDGVLREEMRLPRQIHSDVTLRLKVMAGLDITERRRPQDGRIKITIEGQSIDLRMSVLPTIYGEKTVLRLLDKSSVVLRVAEMGYLPGSQDAVEQMLRLSTGLILVTGPTGSGKTTTQYALLNELNTPGRNIITVEDPVEYRMDGVNQVQVNARIGVGFASSLRAVLRQDPDVVVVGEVRDRETAEIAVRAALTGHLVLATVHTNSACATPARLIDMGVEPFLVSATMIGVISQRLVRRICPECREQVGVLDPAEETFLASFGVHKPQLWRGRGCPGCRGTGYRGRLPVEEVLTITRGVRRLLGARVSEEQVEEAARHDGFRTMIENGVDKVLAGLTTLQELWRAVYSLEDALEQQRQTESRMST